MLRDVPKLLFAALLLSMSINPLTVAANDDASLRWLAIGDSYTIGEGVPESERWPMQLARALRDDGIALADPRIIATTGWTTDELAAAMDAAEPLGEWDLVSLLVGVNNQYRGRSVENFAEEFESLLQRAIALARRRSDRVVVLTIPDWGVTRFGAQSGRDLARVAAELDAYNAAVIGIARTHGVAVVDIAPLSRARGAEAAMQAEDGLHPSGALYAEWAALVAPVVRALLPDSAARYPR